MDLSAAIEAAGGESTASCNLCEYYIGGVDLCQSCREGTEHMLTAALPFIERQVREQVATEISEDPLYQQSLQAPTYSPFYFTVRAFERAITTAREGVPAVTFVNPEIVESFE